MPRNDRTAHLAGTLRLQLFFSAAVFLVPMAILVGCASHLQQQSSSTVRKRPIASPDSLQLVRDLARPWGTKWLEVQGITLAMGLSGTGSDPPPSVERSMLAQEMSVRDVHNPDTVLASPNSSLIIVRGLIPPGAQKGDRIDIDVRVPTKSETTSLKNGWAMLTRLREYAVLKNRLSEGHILAHCQGDLLVDALIESSDDPVLLTRGRILGGGVVGQSRDLGLRLRDEHLSVKSSAKIGEAINKRFHIYANGDKKGVAIPRRDSFVSLAVHPRYRTNIVRYVRVIENIAVRESNAALSNRLKTLKERLLNPKTASLTSVQLEAIGSDAVPVLRDGLKSSNPEVRFYASEALGYLDDPSAAAVLADSIRSEPAFRWRAFLALGAMDRLEAQEELGTLLHAESAETRYGAFRTLQRLAPSDPSVRGKALGGKLRLHRVDSAGPPLVHVAKSERPEIVIFGDDKTLLSPVVLFAGSEIVVRDTADGRVRVRRLTADDSDEQRLVEPRLDAVIEAIVELGGGYTDVVQAISEARRNGCLQAKLAFSAIPRPGRKYKRDWGDKKSKTAVSLAKADDDASPDATSRDSDPVVDEHVKKIQTTRSDATGGESSGQANHPHRSTHPPSAPIVSILDQLDEVDGTDAGDGLFPFDEDPDVVDSPATVIEQIGP